MDSKNVCIALRVLLFLLFSLWFSFVKLLFRLYVLGLITMIYLSNLFGVSFRSTSNTHFQDKLFPPNPLHLFDHFTDLLELDPMTLVGPYSDFVDRLHEPHSQRKPLHSLHIRNELLDVTLRSFGVDDARVAHLCESRNAEVRGPLLERTAFLQGD